MAYQAYDPLWRTSAAKGLPIVVKEVSGCVPTGAFTWSGWSKVQTVFTDWNGGKQVPIGSYTRPSITTNAYHPLSRGAQTGSPAVNNSALTSIVCEYLSAGGSQSLQFRRYNSNITSKHQNSTWDYCPKLPQANTLPAGYWPNITFQTFGDYSIGSFHANSYNGPYAPNFTNALVSPSLTGTQATTCADPSSQEAYFAKRGDFASTDSTGLVNFRAYEVHVDSNNYFKYLLGEMLVTFPDSSESPVGWVDIPDSVPVVSRGDVETVLQTRPFSIGDGCLLSYVHSFAATDSITPYVALGARNMLNYQVQLVTDTDTLLLESVTVVGAADSSTVVETFIPSDIDTIAITGIGPFTTARIRVRVLVVDADTSAFVHQDSVAYIVENIFSDCVPRDSSGNFLKRTHPMRWAGRAGWQPSGFNAVDLFVFPNPCSSGAAVSFVVPEEDVGSPGKVMVYDLMGRDVATLLEGTMPAGRSSVLWDGGMLPPGAYVVAVQLATHAESKEIVLRK